MRNLLLRERAILHLENTLPSHLLSQWAARSLTSPLGDSGPPTNEAMLEVLSHGEKLMRRLVHDAGDRFFETAPAIATIASLERVRDGTATSIDFHRVEMFRRLLGLMGKRYRTTVLSRILVSGLWAGIQRDRILAERGEPRIFTLALHTTSECPQNPRCPGCYAGQSVGSLDYATQVRVVREAVQQGARIILLLGGDPLLGWRDVIRLARKNSRRIFIAATGGLPVTRAYAAAAARVGNIITVFNVPGPEETTNRVRQNPRAWALLTRGIGYLQEAGAARGWITTVYANTWEAASSPEFAWEMERRGMMFGLSFPCMTPLGWDPQPNLVPSREMMDGYSERIRQLRDVSPVPFIPADRAGEQLAFAGGCPAARGLVASVQSDGLVGACPMYPVTNPELSVYKHPLGHILRMQQHQILHDNNGGQSGLCVGASPLIDMLLPVIGA